MFDQKKFKKKDQGFLGVINIRIGDVIELVAESDGMRWNPPLVPFLSHGLIPANAENLHCRPDAHARSQKIDR